MYLTPAMLGLSMTQAELDETLRNMPVTLKDFSRYTCLDGRAYGVKTLGDSCDAELNSCAKASLITRLIEANNYTSDFLGYTLGKHYWRETLLYRYPKFALSQPFLDKVNVRLQTQIIDSLGDISISFYYDENAPLATEGGFRVLEIPVYCGSPSDFVYRNPSSGVLVYPEETPFYPKREGETWKIAFDSSVTSLMVHHKQNVFVRVDNCPDGAYPVHQRGSSVQAIPYLKVVQVSSSQKLFIIPVWYLTDEAFFDEGADYTQYETYKLVPSIRFAQDTEVEESAVYVQYGTIDDEDDDTFRVADPFYLVNRHHSVLEYRNRYSADCHLKHVDAVTVWYSTDSSQWGSQIGHPDLVRAISHLVAAELPLSVCECEIKSGFIQMAQKPYSEVRVNPITGEMITNLKHGNLYGQLVYSEIIGRYAAFRRMVMV